VTNCKRDPLAATDAAVIADGNEMAAAARGSLLNKKTGCLY